MSRYRSQKTKLLIAVLITLGVAAGLQLNLFREASVSAREAAETGMLYMPGLDRGEGWRTTINLTNLESETVNVVIIAYDQAGRALGEVEALTTLEGSQTTALDAQTLPPGVAALTIKAGGRIAGNAAFRYGDGAKAEVIPALSRSARQLDFPLLLNKNLAEQTVTLLNPNQDGAAATLLAFSRNGVELERQSLPLIAPLESRSLKLTEVFGDGARAFGRMRSVATVRIVSDHALVGWQTAAQTGGDLAGLPALVEKSLGWSFYQPASGQEQKLQTTIRLYNPGEAPANVSVEAFESGQSSIGVIEEFQLAPGAIHFFSAPNAAWLRVASDQPISGYQLFGVANGRGLAAAPGIADEDRINVGYTLTGSADGAVLMAYPLMRLDDGSLAAGFAGTPEDDWSMTLSKFNEQAKAAIEGRTEAAAAAAVSNYPVSGKVTRGLQPLSGVLMTFTRVSGTGAVPAPVSNDLNGNWSSPGFAGNTVYRVTPSRKGYVFTPASLDFSSASGALSFYGNNALAVSGWVTDSAGGFGIAGVTITFTHASTGQMHSTVTTEADGYYPESVFKAGVTYRATPSKAGMTFTPASRDFNTSNTALNFTAISAKGFSASGRVKVAGNLSLSGVLMTFTRVSGTGAVPAPVSNDLNGNWSTNGFAGNTIYRVTPSRKGYVFTLASLDFSSASSGLNFIGANTIYGSGKVTDSAGGFGIAGVTITFTFGSKSQLHSTVTTDADGYYREESGFKAGVTYRATPSKAGMTFTPASQDFNADNPALNFTAISATGFKASGKVAGDGGPSLSGVLMTFTRVSGTGIVPPPVSTDLNGNWSSPGFAGNTVYRVTPSRKGYVFYPASLDFSSASSALSFYGATTIYCSGRVTDSVGGFGIAGVTITFTHASTGQLHSTVTTDADGYYLESEFKAGVTYRATPSKAGLSFTPASRDFNANIVKMDFAAAAN